jgi:hypothetical protein
MVPFVQYKLLKMIRSLAFAFLLSAGFEVPIWAQSGSLTTVKQAAEITLGSQKVPLPVGTQVTVMNVRGETATISFTQPDGTPVIAQIPTSALALQKMTSPLLATTSVAPTAAPEKASSIDIFVSPQGNDQSAGTLDQPVASLSHAQKMARRAKAEGLSVHVYLRQGTYYLPAPLVFISADSGTKAAPVLYEAYHGEKPVISGGLKLTGLNWTPYKDGIMQTPVPHDLQTDQLFVNGERQILARYPNYDQNVLIFNGHAADAISQKRVNKWSDPAGGFFHAMHPSLWGDFSYEITGKTPDGKLMLSGGWQNNRPTSGNHDFVGDVPGVHHDDRFVENIFEELDAPGEWYLNTKTHVLYFYPPDGLDLNHATVEAVRLKDLLEFRGSDKDPVQFVTLKGLTFTQTLRTFMETKEPIVRTDWALYRGGAIFSEGTEDCAVEDSLLDQLGGNAVFVNNYNRRFTVEGCHIFRAGANGIVFLGDPKAARSPLFNYDNRQGYHDIDQTAGPQTDNYPAECLVDNCLIHQTGRFEKQTAPVEIDLAQDITIRHCSIYDVPRAGINIGDGCWGGHIIEFCDVFDTVKETGDHGSFNSWGRDRWWGLTDIDLNTAIDSTDPDLPRLDAVKPIILRNNRWRCDHGWDIDLDDGSSNYIITNNLCLNGGIKNREGFYRVVENNIMVNNSFCPHVWFRDSQDIFRHNLIWGGYRPAVMGAKPWGKEMDDNLVVKVGATGTTPATELHNASGRDENSIEADPQFMDAAHGDYRVKDGSPALALGFVNFPMNQFGVQKAELVAIALTPPLPGGGPAPKQVEREDATTTWNGMEVRNIRDEGEMSAYGLPGVTGVLILNAETSSNAAHAGLQPDDVILGLNDVRITQVSDLVNAPAAKPYRLKVSRQQREIILSF